MTALATTKHPDTRDHYFDGAYRLVFADDHEHADGVNVTVRLGSRHGDQLRLGMPLHMEPKIDGSIRRGEVLFTSRTPLAFMPSEWLDGAPSRGQALEALRKALEVEYGVTVQSSTVVTVVGYKVAA